MRSSASRCSTRAPAGLFALLGALLLASGCSEPEGDPLRIVVPRGASFGQVADTLAARGIIGERVKPVFEVYARIKDADTGVRAGQYEFRRAERWSRILTDLTEGRALTARLVIPEGFTLDRMAPRLAVAAEIAPDSVRAVVGSSAELAAELGVPGPGLEGYLFPDTYFVQPGTALEDILAVMVRRYQAYWTPERRARLAEIGMSEREIVTLASIIQAEAVWTREMPLIASVYHNRLRIGQALYADPTVLYALGGHRERLLYAAIDSVADNPYNTYRHPGLPPGPIGSPGAQALDAALEPEESPYFYFVARPDGTHLFTVTIDDHNAARARASREWDTAQAAIRAPAADLDSAGGPAEPR